MKPWILLTLLLASSGAGTANLTAEARLSAEIRGALNDAETVELEAEGWRFLALWRRSAAADRFGAAVVLHGRGAHADSPFVVRPLALGLPEAGWDTLSLQLPVAGDTASPEAWEALIPEAAPRIRSALAWFAQQGIGSVVLIGHDLGALAAVDFLAQATPPAAVRAVVLISAAAPNGGGSARLTETLRAVELPVFDVYGQRDLPWIQESARQRRLAARDAGNDAYTQVELPGADHQYTGVEDLLVSRVRGWMRRYAAEDLGTRD